VNPAKAFSHQFELSGLSAWKAYELLVEASPLKGKQISASLKGKFKTAHILTRRIIKNDHTLNIDI
jgi:hypothetical protein